MKKNNSVLMVSVIAILATGAARADIASTTYVNTQIQPVADAVATKQAKLSGTEGNVVLYGATDGATGSMAVHKRDYDGNNATINAENAEIPTVAYARMVANDVAGSYVGIEQGGSNANKVLVTNGSGDVEANLIADKHIASGAAISISKIDGLQSALSQHTSDISTLNSGKQAKSDSTVPAAQSGTSYTYITANEKVGDNLAALDAGVSTKAAQSDLTALTNRVSANETAIETLNDDENNANSVAGKIATALTAYTPTTGLATVATSGSYSDLSGTPNLATVATSGSYNDLINKPTIPAAQVNSDWNASSGVAQILNKPTLGTMAAENKTDYYTKTAADAQFVEAPATALQATTATNYLVKYDAQGLVTGGEAAGALAKKSIVGTSDIDAKAVTTAKLADDVNTALTAAGTAVQPGDIVEGTTSGAITVGSTAVPVHGLATVATSGAYSDLSGTPNLATVATSGSYNDLTNKPTIPAAQVNSDWNASSGVAQILNKPTLGTAAAANLSTNGVAANDGGLVTGGQVQTAITNLNLANTYQAKGDSNVTGTGLNYITTGNGVATNLKNLDSQLKTTDTNASTALTTANAAIPKPQGTCTDCVLHYNGNNYSWEEVGR